METSLHKNVWVAGLIHRFILGKFRLNKWPNDKSASTCCKHVKSNGGWSSSRLLVYLSSVVYWSSSRQQCSLPVWTKKPWPSHQDSSYLTVLVLSCPLCRYLIERVLQSLEMILFLWNPSLVITLPCPLLSHSLTKSMLLLLRLDQCEPCMWNDPPKYLNT